MRHDRAIAVLSLLLAAAPPAAQASLQPTPAALQIVRARLGADELGAQILRPDRDILLEPGEAQAAAEAFRQIADANGDGRVTPQEYRAARAFILARY